MVTAARTPSVRASPFAPREKVEVVVLLGAIGIATAVAFLLLLWVSTLVASTPFDSGPAGYGLITFFTAGLLAYTFGLRHAVDADHIAAIDNTTRKLLQEGRRPLTVGTWFSLGHSTVVFAMALGIILAANAVNSAIPAIQHVGSILGTSISGAFLILIGLVNLVVALEIYRIFQRLKRGDLSELELEEQLQKRGFMIRYFGRLFRVIERPRQMYPVGVLFGLGFDTASEIFLLAVTAVVALAGAPLYIALVLPLLFAVGMVLVDTIDGITMRFAYGWAFHRPLRKVFYNLTVTIISVLVAFAIGGVELLQVVATEFGWSGSFWTAFVSLDFEILGYVVIATFVLTWGAATAYYRYKRYDQVGWGEGSRGAPSPGASDGSRPT